MKKVISSLLVASMLLLAHNASASNVTPDQAKKAAATFMSKFSKYTETTSNDVVLIHQDDNLELNVPAAYYFNVGDFGWIIMAATTVIDPVIGFSSDGNLDLKSMPENLRWWLDSYVKDVIFLQNADAEKALPDSPEWLELANGTLEAPKGSKVVLMNEFWDQGNTRNPTYNRYCPAYDGRYSVTGCVATALSQICHYYKYPVQTAGGRKQYWGRTHPSTYFQINFDTVAPFNYSLMPNILLSTSSDAQINEVARLCYTVGLSVEMDYDPDGSGTSYPNNINGVTRYLGYPDAFVVSRLTTDDTSFYNSMLRELLEGNVLYMDGYSEGSSGPDAGHAWVCGGYWERSTGKYYYWMNWGWGPGDHNTFYNLAAGNGMAVGGYNYNAYLTYISGMVPPADTTSEGIASVDGTRVGTPYPNPATINVTIPYSVNHASDLNLYSVDGKLVYTSRVNGSGDCEINVTGMPAGVYIYRINSLSGKITIQ